MDAVRRCHSAGNGSHGNIGDIRNTLEGESLTSLTGSRNVSGDESKCRALRRVDWVLGDVLNKRSVKWNGT